MIADITMSTDNVLAVAGASHGNLFLLVFGLALSIPFVIFTSNLLSMIMDKYPIIILLGAAVLGRVGGEMMITDSWVENLLHPTKVVEYGVQIFFTVGVVVLGKYLVKRKTAKEQKEENYLRGVIHSLKEQKRLERRSEEAGRRCADNV